MTDYREKARAVAAKCYGNNLSEIEAVVLAFGKEVAEEARREDKDSFANLQGMLDNCLVELADSKAKLSAFTSATPDSLEVKEALSYTPAGHREVVARALRAALARIKELEKLGLGHPHACVPLIDFHRAESERIEWVQRGERAESRAEAAEAKLANLEMVFRDDAVVKANATLTAALGNWREVGLSLWAQFASYDFNGGKKYDNMALSALEDLEDALNRAGLLGGAGEPLWENINRSLPTPPAAEGEKP